jgi:hypothetical protein
MILDFKENLTETLALPLHRCHTSTLHFMDDWPSAGLRRLPRFYFSTPCHRTTLVVNLRRQWSSCKESHGCAPCSKVPRQLRTTPLPSEALHLLRFVYSFSRQFSCTGALPLPAPPRSRGTVMVAAVFGAPAPQPFFLFLRTGSSVFKSRPSSFSWTVWNRSWRHRNLTT